MKIKKVGVLGAGNIGIGVVTDLILHDVSAVVVDVSDEILQAARDAVLSNVRFAPMLLKSLPKISKQEALDRMQLTTDMRDLISCDFVIENVTENWEIKRAVYETLDRTVPPEVCFGANTSCISITKIAGATQRPANVVGIHLMNPVHLKPTVEVIRGFHTSDRTIETLLQLFAQLNKESIIVEDLPGFVSNRHLSSVHERGGVRPSGSGRDAGADRFDFQKMFRPYHGSVGDGGSDRIGYGGSVTGRALRELSGFKVPLLSVDAQAGARRTSGPQGRPRFL